jgi:hypothetical protein
MVKRDALRSNIPQTALVAALDTYDFQNVGIFFQSFTAFIIGHMRQNC